MTKGHRSPHLPHLYRRCVIQNPRKETVMHSRIFQVSSKPISPEDYLTENDVPESFFNTTADYVDSLSDEERASSIENLKSVLANSFTFQDGAMTSTENMYEYFRKPFESFQANLLRLSHISFDEFCGKVTYGNFSVESGLWRLGQCYLSEYGFYIYVTEYGELVTLDNWLRTVSPGEIYHLGNVLDYHA